MQMTLHQANWLDLRDSQPSLLAKQEPTMQESKQEGIVVNGYKLEDQEISEWEDEIEEGEIVESDAEIEEGEIVESRASRRCSFHQHSLKQKQDADSQGSVESSEYRSSDSLDQIKETYKKRMKMIFQTQMVELTSFNKVRDRVYEKEKAALVTKTTETFQLTCNSNSESSVKEEKLKMIVQDFMRKEEQLKTEIEMAREKFLATQRQRRDKEKQIKADLMKKAKLGKSMAEGGCVSETSSLSSRSWRVQQMQHVYKRKRR